MSYPRPIRCARKALPALLALGVVLVAASPAAAQGRELTDAEVQEARALFVAGQAAVESSRWADAVESFSRAYELSGVGSALYNVAYALRALGRNVEAREAFDRLLSEHPNLDEEMRSEAERLRAEVAARVAVLSLAGLDPNQRYVVRVDAQGVPDEGERPLEVETDPGAHTVTVRGDAGPPFVWEGEASEGQTVAIDVELVAPAEGEEPEDEEPRPVTKRAGFWVGVGLAVVAVAVGVGLAARPDQTARPLNPDRTVDL